jgi:tetratricopeptide (TPR) repeat protein
LVAGDGAAIIPLLLDLLVQAPQLKLLITSRQRLNLRQEWVLPLDGLAADDNAGVLFVERARQHGTVRVNDAPSVNRICRLLGGSPLGIELVAGLTAQQSCAAIARQLTQDLDAAAASWRDVMPRHRSLRVVFEQSWRQLPPPLQTTLARLSLFQGGFSAEAARRVCGAAESDLRLLVDRSLLAGENGRFDAQPTAVAQGKRFDLHPVIQQFAQGKLDAMGETGAIWAAYGGYYADFLQQREPTIAEPPTLAEIDGEWSNIAAAWGWMMAEERVTAVCQSIIPLFTFLETRARYQEGASMMGEAVNMLAAVANSPDARLAYGYALMFQGAFIGNMGRFNDALAKHKRSLPIFQSLSNEQAMAWSLNYHALNLQDLGRYDEAETYCQRGLALYQKLNDKSGIASAIKTLGHIDYNSGRWEQAREHYEQTAVLYEKLGNRRESSAMLLNLGNIAYKQGAYAEAKARYSESLLFKEVIGDLSGIARATHNLGITALALKEYEEARRFSNRSIQTSLSINVRQVTASSYNLLGDVAVAQNEHEAARAAFRQALALAREGQYEALIAKVSEKLATLGKVKMNENS